jgi:hypothetical protein
MRIGGDSFLQDELVVSGAKKPVNAAIVKDQDLTLPLEQLAGVDHTFVGELWAAIASIVSGDGRLGLLRLLGIHEDLSGCCSVGANRARKNRAIGRGNRNGETSSRPHPYAVGRNVSEMAGWLKPPAVVRSLFLNRGCVKPVDCRRKTFLVCVDRQRSCAAVLAVALRNKLQKEIILRFSLNINSDERFFCTLLQLVVAQDVRMPKKS